MPRLRRYSKSIDWDSSANPRRWSYVFRKNKIAIYLDVDKKAITKSLLQIPVSFNIQWYDPSGGYFDRDLLDEERGVQYIEVSAKDVAKAKNDDYIAVENVVLELAAELYAYAKK
jgi:hypothetical protein